MVDEVNELNAQFAGSWVAATAEHAGFEDKDKRKKFVYPVAVNGIMHDRSGKHEWLLDGTMIHHTVGMKSFRRKAVLLNDKQALLFPDWRYGAQNVLTFGTCYVSRVPARQWRRGIRRQYLDLRVPLQEDFLQLHRARHWEELGNGLAVQLDGPAYYSMLVNMLNPEYTPWRTAVAQLFEGVAFSRAVHRHFILQAMRGWSCPAILFKDSTIGYVSETGRAHVLKSAACWREVLEELSGKTVRTY